MDAPSVQDGVLHLSGDLTLGTAGALYRRCEEVWEGAERPDTIDLSGTGRIDSAGLALLLEWQARARAQNRPLSFVHPSERLIQLADLCEATEWLGLEPSDTP